MFAGLIPLVFLTGCVTGPVSEAAVCDGTARLRPAHAAALVEDGGPVSRRTGAELIAAVDAGCA